MRKSKVFAFICSLMLVFQFSIPTAFANESGSNTEYEPENPGILDEQTDSGKKGMVVSAHPLASKVGADVLKSGGNAVDAAVAVQLALNVVEPMMSGIGGGGFMMVYDAKQDEVKVINSRESAPAGASPDMFLGEDGKPLSFSNRVQSGLSVGVPGTLKGLEASLEKWGTMSLAELLEPSIKMAEEGVPVNWVLANAIKNNESKLAKSPASYEAFFPNGQALKEGEILVQKDLANTFKAIAKDGTAAFYNGEIGQKIASAVQEKGGSMELSDLQSYDVTELDPVWGDYKGHEIATMPPPSSGGLTMLQLLKKFDILDITQYDTKSTEKYHFMTEAMHLAYADRGKYMGDPDYVEIPSEGLLNDDYVKSRVDLINSEKANDDVQPGDPWAFQGGGQTVSVEQVDDKVNGETTHLTVADQWGNVVSYTTTIEQLFGSGIMAPGTGVLLNNELTDFDATPGGANQVEPGKRPLSSMTPTIVFKDGKPYLTVGSPGGATIITSVTQTIVNAIGYEMDIKDAIEEPRIYSNAYPSIRWEYGMPKDVQGALKEKGHQLEAKPQEIGNVNSILIDGNGAFFGAADSTREGTAIGVDYVLGDKIEFKDMENHWSKEFVEEAAAIGIIKGYPDQTFKPGVQLNRIQAAALIVRALDLDAGDVKAPFNDISGYSKENQAEINAAYRYAIVKGFGKEFRPNEKVTRAQMALMLYRAYEIKTGKPYYPSEKAPYTDYNTSNQETIDAISTLYELEIATGVDGKFKPLDSTTRGEAAKMLLNFYKLK